MTSEGTPHGRFQRAIATKNLFMAQMAAKEMRGPMSLIDALHLGLLAGVKPGAVEHAAIRWHGRLELEKAWVTMDESHFALAALAHLRYDPAAVMPILKRLLHKTH